MSTLTTVNGTPFAVLKEIFDQMGALNSLLVLVYPNDPTRSFKALVAPDGVQGGYTQKGKPPPPVHRAPAEVFKLPERQIAKNVSTVADDSAAADMGFDL